MCERIRTQYCTRRACQGRIMPTGYIHATVEKTLSTGVPASPSLAWWPSFHLGATVALQNPAAEGRQQPKILLATPINTALA